MSDDAAAPATVSVVQFDPSFGDVAANVEYTRAEIAGAADDGADLVVLPELATTGYVFGSREEAFSLAQPTDGGAVSAWTAAASAHDVWVVGGFAERDDRRLYNSAAVISPQGVETVYRKAHLWDREKLWFEPGDTGFPVVDAPFGRIGVQICNDLWYPEAARLQALDGADLLAVPTNWVEGPMDADRPGGWTIGLHMAVSAANANRVFVAAADRTGGERGATFEGQSAVVAPTGRPVTDVGPVDDDATLTATVDLAEARQKQLADLAHAFDDRRDDLYRLEDRSGVDHEL